MAPSRTHIVRAATAALVLLSVAGTRPGPARGGLAGVAVAPAATRRAADRRGPVGAPGRRLLRAGALRPGRSALRTAQQQLGRDQGAEPARQVAGADGRQRARLRPL